jgi:hypothetical protein
MPKDRFSKFKPVNWNSDWKKTGNFGSQYNTLERKDAYDAYAENAKLKQQITIQKQQVQAPAKPKKTVRTPDQTNVLQWVYDSGKEHMSEWESNFLSSIIAVPFQISPKQKEIIRGIIKKYDLEKLTS